jgi:hypothetical protein
MIVPQGMILGVCRNYLPSIELIAAAENGLPRSFMMPRDASSAEISRSDLRPPLGRLRRN